MQNASEKIFFYIKDTVKVFLDFKKKKDDKALLNRRGKSEIIPDHFGSFCKSLAKEASQDAVL